MEVSFGNDNGISEVTVVDNQESVIYCSFRSRLLASLAISDYRSGKVCSFKTGCGLKLT